jgi:glucose/arabinose dehydrogenase
VNHGAHPEAAGMRAVFFFLAAFTIADVRPADGLHVRSGFQIDTIASVQGARELAVLPNGDLIVGTHGSDVYIVPDAEGNAEEPKVFAHFDDDLAAGVAYAADRREIYVGTEQHVWAIPYRTGERTASAIHKIADVRTGPPAPATDGDVHTTTSVAYANGLVYVSAGSSCNATMAGGKPCTEVDSTRAAVSVLKTDGSGFRQRARRIRNAIALAVNPQTGSVWVGDAGQDDLPFGHPYEFVDDLSAHAGDADYGWPACEENRHPYVHGADCSMTVEPLVELPAYSTIVGAAFYPAEHNGRHAFPAAYRGGLFVAAHGSWHRGNGGCNAEPPRVVFVPMHGDRPARGVDWQNPAAQWSDFVTGFQSGCSSRSGRPTGLGVGPQGSLFIGDDDAGAIYRVRPKHG